MMQIRRNNIRHSAILLLLPLLLTACSTTRNLPEGETLYTGIKRITVTDPNDTPAGRLALDEAEAALAAQPNNALLGSSSIRVPFPFGLWAYNSFVRYEKGLGKWMFNRLATKPVLISTVNPEIRVRLAQNLLRDYGFFNGKVSYRLLPTKKRQAKIQYDITMGRGYLLDSIAYLHYSPTVDSLLQTHSGQSLLHAGDNFSVVTLQAERERLSNLFRNQGLFYFRPDFIAYRADTLIHPGQVALQVLPKLGLPASALQTWKIGAVSLRLTGCNGEAPTDSLLYRDLMVYYYGDRPAVRPSVIYNRMSTRPGDRYSQQAQNQTRQAINSLGIFRYADLQYTPADTTAACRTLNLQLNTALDLPLDGELELNFTSKSNDQLGPGALFSLSKRNLFRGGETLSATLRGSYEWQTGAHVDGNSALINSYELGLSTTLDLPRIAFPWLHRRRFAYPATSSFRLYADQLNRARFFKLLAFGGNATYRFQPNARSKHDITPFRLTFNLLQSTTARFDTTLMNNPAIELSLRNQFIPAMAYTYTYDDATVSKIRNHTWWETSFTSAGNLLSTAYRLAGKPFDEEKKLLGNSFAQFLKLTTEVRYNINLGHKQNLVSRFMAGAVYSYGNAKVAPYNEQFFIGGANSIRAFTARSLGPGSYRPLTSSTYSYLDQTGDLKLEANVEYRFNILGDLYGATFLDAGNIWLLRPDAKRPGGEFSFKTLGKDMALGTGVGLRYDMTFLVIRFDVGIALHAPYETSRKGYYNIPKFKDGLGFHLAIGYPF